MFWRNKDTPERPPVGDHWESPDGSIMFASITTHFPELAEELQRGREREKAAREDARSTDHHG